MTHFLSKVSGTIAWILENPAQFTTSSLFLAGFGWFAGNALIAQDAVHVSPIWDTTSIVGSVSPRLEDTGETIVPIPTHSVLTQRISLKNIPVPTISPVKMQLPAAHSSLVREVQAVLADVGIYQGKVDGIFGDETKRAILEYQQTAGIIPDGEASFGLLGHIKSAFAVAQVQNGAAPKRLTSSQPELIVLDPATVEAVQAGLKEFYGTEDIIVDGIFGSQTRNALRKFQQRFSLTVTGELDSATLNKLREAGVVGTTL